MVHCVKSVCIRSSSGPYFLALRLITERYSVSLRIQSKYGKIRTRITPDTETFYAVVEEILCKLMHAFLLFIQIIWSTASIYAWTCFIVLFNFVLQICIILYLNGNACNIQMIPRYILQNKESQQRTEQILEVEPNNLVTWSSETNLVSSSTKTKLMVKGLYPRNLFKKKIKKKSILAFRCFLVL